MANGDFKVLVSIAPVGVFLSGPIALLLNVGTFNGVNTTTGFSIGNFNSGRVDGSGNLRSNAAAIGGGVRKAEVFPRRGDPYGLEPFQHVPLGLILTRTSKRNPKEHEARTFSNGAGL